MGYEITIRIESDDLLARLTRDPWSVFPKAYAGYLLFLFSEIDADVWAWFRRYVLELDALTGRDIAFAIAAARTRLRVLVRSSQRRGTESRSSVCRGEVDLAELPRESAAWDIRRLVTSGSFGWFEDGDEVAAVSRAAYDLARHLNVLDQLPCVIVLDAVPDAELPWTVLHLDERTLQGLIPALRLVIGGLRQQRAWGELERRLNELTSSDAERRRLMREFEVPSERTFLASQRDQLGEAIAEGRWAEISALAPRLGADESALKALRATLRIQAGVEHHLARAWPTTAERLLDYTKMWRRACSVVETLPPDPPMSRDELLSVQGLLAEHRRQVARHILDSAITVRDATLRDQVESEKWRMERDEVGRQLWNASRRSVELLHELIGASKDLSFQRALRRELTPEAAPGLAPGGIQPWTWLDWAPLEKLLAGPGAHAPVALAALAQATAATFGPALVERRPTAFASYASEDRAEVLRRIQGMRAVQPHLDIFLDFHDLFPGDVWKARLVEEIAQRDRFFLFWSRAAARSECVRLEWQAACQLGKPLTPVPLEPPTEAPPPAELMHLHFDDRHLRLIEYEEGGLAGASG